MTKAVTVEWNFDLEEGKNQGIVLVLGRNSDNSIGVGYALWDSEENAWLSDVTLRPMPNFTVDAWMKDYTLIPENMVP